MVDAGLKLKEREAKMTTSTTAVNQRSLMAANRLQMKGRNTGQRLWKSRQLARQWATRNLSGKQWVVTDETMASDTPDGGEFEAESRAVIQEPGT